MRSIIVSVALAAALGDRTFLGNEFVGGDDRSDCDQFRVGGSTIPA